MKVFDLLNETQDYVKAAQEDLKRVARSLKRRVDADGLSYQLKFHPEHAMLTVDARGVSENKRKTLDDRVEKYLKLQLKNWKLSNWNSQGNVYEYTLKLNEK